MNASFKTPSLDEDLEEISDENLEETLEETRQTHELRRTTKRGLATKRSHLLSCAHFRAFVDRARGTHRLFDF